MKRIIFLLALIMPLCGVSTLSISAQTTTVKNPWMWIDAPDPDIIRVDDYYYLVTTTMHVFPGAPIMRSKDLINWETVSYLFDEIHDTPRYDLEEGTVYGRGQWATTIRYNNGTFWALFVANDEPHKSMVFKTDDPAKGWTLHGRLPAYHDASLFFDDDGRVYVFWGSGDIQLVELEPDLSAEKAGGVRKKLELKGRPSGLHEGSRVVKHDGMYYLLCVSWPNTGRQQIAYRSNNIEGPYESKVILKSEFGGFGYVGQGTIVDGKHGEWYGVIFQDRNGIGRVLTLEPCNWIDGWPILGDANGKVPEEVVLDVIPDSEMAADGMRLYSGVSVSKDFQWNHNPIKEDIIRTDKQLTLTTSKIANTIYDARNTLTWRTWGPTCSDYICIDASKMKDGDRTGLAAFNGDSGVLSVKRDGNKWSLEFTEENVALSNGKKEITDVKKKVVETVALSKSKAKHIYLRFDGDFNPGKDIANFFYSFDGENWTQIGGNYKMIFDYRRLFMGTRYAAFYYPTKETGGTVTINYNY